MVSVFVSRSSGLGSSTFRGHSVMVFMHFTVTVPLPTSVYKSV